MKKFAPLFGLGTGVLIAIPLAFFTVLAMGGGHGTYLPARLLFPFTMFSTFLGGSITSPFIVIGLVQFPIYGLLSGIFYRLGRVRAGMIGVALVHCAAIVLNFIVPTEFFQM